VKVTVGNFLATREVPAEWEASLAAVSPKSDTLPWLKLAWMAGMPYEVVGRWVLYEMIPLSMVNGQGKSIVPDFLLNALRGQDPRTLGEWTTDVDPETLDAIPSKRRWVSHSTVSRLQWELFRATNCAPFLFWIIQGRNGGHRWRLPAIEKHFITSLYGPEADVPLPGERPYADFDQRTLDQVVRHDKLAAWERQRRSAFGVFPNATAAGVYVAKSTYDQEQVYAATMLKYLTDQIEDGVSNLSDADIQRIMARQKSGNDLAGTDIQAVEQRLVENTTHQLPRED
jgi:hypothetical protein